MNEETGHRLSKADVRRVREDFLHYIARGSCFLDYWRGLLSRSLSQWGLGDDEMVSAAPAVSGYRQRIQRSLRSGGAYTSINIASTGKVELSITTPAEEAHYYSSQLGATEVYIFEAILLRALFPFAALATWPLELMFSEEEIALMLQIARLRPMEKREYQTWQPGQDMNYGGYCCIIVKVTRHCNLRCIYCNDWRVGAGNSMRFEVLLDVVAKTINNLDYETVDFIWHGGEPTLIGRTGLLRALILQSWFMRTNQRINNRIQSNGTLIDAAWTELLSFFKVSVSVSIDGPPELHDLTRPGLRNRPSFERTMHGIRMLEASGVLSGILMVVTDALVEYGAKRLVGFLQSENLTRVGLLPVLPPNRTLVDNEEYLSLSEYISFLVDVQRERTRSATPWIAVRELDSLILSARRKMGGHCEILGNCLGSFLSVEPDGRVSHCDKYLGDESFVLGNIRQHGIAELLSSSRLNNLRMANKSALAKFESECKYFSMCRGWCPHHRYVKNLHGIGSADTCCGLSLIYEYFDESLQK